MHTYTHVCGRLSHEFLTGDVGVGKNGGGWLDLLNTRKALGGVAAACSV